jgi:shikimate dehydrogenase
MHRAALAAVGASGDYQVVDLEPAQLEPGVGELIRRGFTGFNVTIPHKQKMLSVCHDLTAEARLVRAVNTVKIEPAGRLVGHNTDLCGFRQSLNQVLPPSGRRNAALILGSGGAARAAAWALVEEGWPHIAVVARNTDRAGVLVEEIIETAGKNARAGGLPRFHIADTGLARLTVLPELVVNCTAIGLAGEAVPDWLLPVLRWMDPEGLVFDMVYSRQSDMTPLVRVCRQLRLSCCDGSDMLARQARLSFQFWTGQAVPLAVFAGALGAARLPSRSGLESGGHPERLE